jgi:hypothetical protein
MPGEWLGAVSAVSTGALVVFTAYHVRLSHNLLKIQVEPLVELSIDPETADLVLKNAGAYRVSDISSEYNVRALPGPVDRYGKSGQLPLVRVENR